MGHLPIKQTIYKRKLNGQRSKINAQSAKFKSQILKAYVSKSKGR